MNRGISGKVRDFYKGWRKREHEVIRIYRVRLINIPKLRGSRYNQIMSVTIKVLFGDKLYRLALGVQTLEEVGKEMKQRFPEIQLLKYYHDDQEVKELATLFSQLKRQGKTSLKLTAKAENSEIEVLSSCGISKIDSSELRMQSEPSELIEQPSKESTKSRVTLPSDFYLCFNCEGLGEIKEQLFISICPICKGMGKLNDTHKYVKRMQVLYKKHFCPSSQAESILEEFKEEMKPIRKSSVLGLDKSYEVIISEVNKKDKVEINKLFTVRFQIKNEGMDWTQDNIQVIECGSTDGRRVSALKSGNKMVIELGPFICRNESLLEKTYSLCYKEGEELIRFGHKFGFSVKGVKKNEIKKNDCLIREKEKIRDLRMLSGSKKSEEYLGMKLRSMGINLLNIQIEDEVLIELIRQIN